MSTSEDLATVAVTASSTLYVAAMTSFHVLLRWRRRCDQAGGPSSESRAPGDVASRCLVSVLKPLAGADDELDANLDSFASLEGCRYEILFGVSSRSDPAYAAARRFLAARSSIDARIVVTNPDGAINPKVAQLIDLVEASRGDILVVSDSNVRVPPDYLTDLVRHLDDPRCGLATSLFVGSGERTLGAALENVQLAASIVPAIVLSTLGKNPFTVGKSMAMRRADLERLGGFAGFGDYLAEDYMLGRRFVESGFRVATSFRAVQNRNVDGSVKRTFDRHTRWAKLRRALNPGLFPFEPLLAPVLVGAVAVALVPSQLTACAFAAAIVIEMVFTLLAVRALRGTWLPWRYAPLGIIRAGLALACWLAAWWSRALTWRGNRLYVGADTRLQPVGRHSRPGAAYEDPIIPSRAP